MHIPKIPKHVVNAFFLALGYGVAFYILQFFLHQRGVVAQLPDRDNLIAWDAAWYNSIVEKGYEYYPDKGSNSGFFILFPLIWKLLHFGTWKICTLNLLFFATGFAVFNSLYKIPVATRFLWLTIPSFYFVWVPYTEALFILLTCICFYGITHHKRYLIWVSLLLLSLTRPTTLVMVPAFLIAELLVNSRKDWWRAIRDAIVNYILPLILGLGIFIVYQYYKVGVWFAYFKQQEEHWGHKFALPTFPLNSMYGLKLIWLNAAALFVGFVCLLLLIKYGYSWLVKTEVIKDRLFVLSCLYFVGISLVTVLFNPTWATSSTNVYDVHRYAFVSPFFWVLLHRFTIVNTYKPMDYLKVFLLTNVFWVSFMYYHHIYYFLYFTFASVLILLYMMQTNTKLAWVPMAIVVINFVFQLTMFQWFISQVYPG